MMDRATKHSLRAARAWTEDVQLQMDANDAEMMHLQKQNDINTKRIELLKEQNKELAISKEEKQKHITFYESQILS